MNIFNNHFCLSLEAKEAYPQHTFVHTSLPQFKAYLGDEKQWKKGRVFYAKGTTEQAFVNEIGQLLQTEDLAVLHGRLTLIFEESSDVEVFYDLLATNFDPVKAAGGIPVLKEDSILMIYRNGIWDLPKGKLEEGEEISSCAMREVEEETGLTSHQLGERLPDTFHIYERKGWKLKTTYWYTMPVGESTELVPQEEEGITKVEWIPREKVATELPETYPLIKDLIRHYLYRSSE